MPYGTDSFTDRYGDYKQPTVIDYDKSIADGSLVDVSNLSVEDTLNTHKNDIEEVYKEILSFNPFFAGERYISFVQSVQGKLAWNVAKINELKDNSDWLFSFRKHLNRAKANFVLNKKP